GGLGGGNVSTPARGAARPAPGAPAHRESAWGLGGAHPPAVSLPHDAGEGVVDRLRRGVSHADTEHRQLPEERPRLENRQFQLLSRWAQSRQADPAALEQEQAFGPVLLVVDDVAFAYGRHPGLAVDLLDLLVVEVAEDVDLPQKLLLERGWRGVHRGFRLPPSQRSQCLQAEDALWHRGLTVAGEAGLPLCPPPRWR